MAKSERRRLIIERAENARKCREEQELLHWIIAIIRRNRQLGFQV